MAESFRMRLNESRSQRLKDLVQATGESTQAKAVDAATRTYLELVGGNMVRPGQGVLDEVLEAAEERGGLSAGEIAEILSTQDLPIKYEPPTWSIGVEDIDGS